MSQTPFAAVPPTAEGHFKLYLYAAILHVLDHLVAALDSQEAAFERFPFLAGYVHELAQIGLDGLTTADAIPWWQTHLRAWEASVVGFLPIRALQEAAGLDYEALVTFFCLGLSEEDPRFGVVYETLHGVPGQHHVTYGLLNAWRGDPDRPVRAVVQQLQATGLIQVLNPETPRVDWSLLPAPLLWDALTQPSAPLAPNLGEPSAPGIGGVGGVTAGRRARPKAALFGWFAYHAPADLLTPDELIINQPLRDQLRQLPTLVTAGEIDTLLLRGPSHNGRKTVLGAIAQTAGCGLLEIHDLKPDDERWRLVGPLATILHALPVVTCELAAGEKVPVPRLAAYTGPVGVVMGRQGGLRDAGQLLTLAVEMPTPEERLQHWQAAAGDAPVVGLEEIAGQFRLASGTIHRAADLARAHARLDGRTEIHAADVQHATRSLGRAALDHLAALVPGFGDWGALAAGSETMQELLSLESRCRHRERLPGRVSPTLASQLTPGVRALFTGPSGTGKTLAARILAASLKMDLYRLDLSSVVNKYIGETEKNLNDLFTRAEELDVILLIDEGDALLTQRTNVQTSNDRYANLETNFLLQRMESYSGIVIITTNAGDRIDSAFQRRMDVIVEFRAPEAAERWAIWQLHLPADHRVGLDVLREVAARCALSGGQIRNTVLHASLLALDDGGFITSAHLDDAVQREYRKMGAVYPLRALRERTR
jgi:hypothetical protein